MWWIPRTLVPGTAVKGRAVTGRSCSRRADRERRWSATCRPGGSLVDFAAGSALSAVSVRGVGSIDRPLRLWREGPLRRRHCHYWEDGGQRSVSHAVTCVSRETTRGVQVDPRLDCCGERVTGGICRVFVCCAVTSRAKKAQLRHQTPFPACSQSHSAAVGDAGTQPKPDGRADICRARPTPNAPCPVRCRSAVRPTRSA